ncbi:MAG TPA: hypothetical protein QGH10_16960, partial [Armatimonadota bacterium]|nr:hypothetical protein [Armatimonadota bacterium]
PKAVVAVTSLDGEPIANSTRLLITTVARVVSPDGKMPLYSEPVKGTLRIRSDGVGMKLAALAPEGSALAPGEAAYQDGWYSIDLSGTSHWYMLER